MQTLPTQWGYQETTLRAPKNLDKIFLKELES